MDGQMKKGVLEFCILSQIHRKEMYGYELMQLVTRAFTDVHEATVYTILRRLHSDGYTETYYGTVSGGPQRKYYRITTEGRQRLHALQNEWRQIQTAVKVLEVE